MASAPPASPASPMPMASPLATALAALPDDAAVTVTVSVGALRAALEQRSGGPAELTTKQASSLLGRSADFWARSAERGLIVGAYRHGARGPWRLPREACMAHLRQLARGASRERGEAASRARGPRSQGAKALRIAAQERRGGLRAIGGGAA